MLLKLSDANNAPEDATKVELQQRTAARRLELGSSWRWSWRSPQLNLIKSTSGFWCSVTVSAKISRQLRAGHARA